MLKCPRDGKPLQEQTHDGGARVDACPTCRGVWLGLGELERIQQAVGPAEPGIMRDIDSVAGKYEAARVKNSPPACPHGHGPMVPKDYAFCSRVVLDGCPKCRGVWLDGGELDTLEEF